MFALVSNLQFNFPLTTLVTAHVVILPSFKRLCVHSSTVNQARLPPMTSCAIWNDCGRSKDCHCDPPSFDLQAIRHRRCSQQLAQSSMARHNRSSSLQFIALPHCHIKALCSVVALLLLSFQLILVAGEEMWVTSETELNADDYFRSKRCDECTNNALAINRTNAENEVKTPIDWREVEENFTKVLSEDEVFHKWDTMEANMKSGFLHSKFMLSIS